MPALHLEMECLNGGVGYGGECLCPTHVSGSRCENAGMLYSSLPPQSISLTAYIDECYKEVAHKYILANPFTHAEKDVSLSSCEITPALVPFLIYFFSFFFSFGFVVFCCFFSGIL
jgi:hypothetical protein